MYEQVAEEFEVSFAWTFPAILDKGIYPNIKISLPALSSYMNICSIFPSE